MSDQSHGFDAVRKILADWLRLIAERFLGKGNVLVSLFAACYSSLLYALQWMDCYFLKETSFAVLFGGLSLVFWSTFLLACPFAVRFYRWIHDPFSRLIFAFSSVPWLFMISTIVLIFSGLSKWVYCNLYIGMIAICLAMIGLFSVLVRSSQMRIEGKGYHRLSYSFKELNGIPVMLSVLLLLMSGSLDLSSDKNPMLSPVHSMFSVLSLISFIAAFFCCLLGFIYTLYSTVSKVLKLDKDLYHKASVLVQGLVIVLEGLYVFLILLELGGQLDFRLIFITGLVVVFSLFYLIIMAANGITLRQGITIYTGIIYMILLVLVLVLEIKLPGNTQIFIIVVMVALFLQLFSAGFACKDSLKLRWLDTRVKAQRIRWFEKTEPYQIAGILLCVAILYITISAADMGAKKSIEQLLWNHHWNKAFSTMSAGLSKRQIQMPSVGSTSLATLAYSVFTAFGTVVTFQYAKTIWDEREPSDKPLMSIHRIVVLSSKTWRWMGEHHRLSKKARHSNRKFRRKKTIGFMI
ncbi:hypothetical protein OZX73_04565 [Bifidobacterium sp. ESL0775]|uniref:hypothetical protein n=1 Tax=Bifidobacterium sp. ESL0775 TaxID=2983230 RepID=UPI0023F788E6|nr:hypothetical protein [Bifidobacterium sp. ESL0775]WEV68578.1 hypothetical protein OZX73_04565 [Bifidobacterium sp. ESL0775]